MTISIITVCYNSESTISSTINSVLSQTYEKIEYIIIDGMSSDNTLKIVKSYSNRIAKVISEKDNGIYDALNKGISFSTGEIIGFVHSDDLLYDENVISKIASLFLKKEIDGVYGDLQYVKKKQTNKIVRYWKSSQYKSGMLKKGWMPAHPTFFLKKTIYLTHGKFNLKYKISADYDFMIRILKDNNLKFYYFSSIITLMRIGGNSNRSIKNILNKIIEDYMIIKLNNIGNIFTLLNKNISKLKQFL